MASADPSTAAAELTTDDALAWLEGLALQQGVDPAELGQTPAATPTSEVADPPAATFEVVDQPTSEPADQSMASADPSTAAAELTTDDALAWLEGLALQQGVDPAELGQTPATTFEVVDPPTGGPADQRTPPAELSTDDAPAWLETLAVQPGVDLSEMETSPETTTVKDGIAESVSPAITDTQPMAPLRLVQTPIASDQNAGSLQSAFETAAKEVEASLPDGANAESPTPEQPVAASETVPAEDSERPAAAPEAAPEAPRATPAEPVRRTSLLAGKLAERRRAREAEIQARFDAQRESREAAQREVEARLAARRAALTGEGGAPVPASEFSLRPTEPLPAGGQALTASALARAGTGPLGVAGTARATPGFAGVDPRDLLERSRAQLVAGQEAFAFEGFTHLIKQGALLDAITIDLERHVAGGAPSTLALRCLGDVYMRAGRLQNALDAYRQALERL
jgi:hypothetical protein